MKQFFQNIFFRIKEQFTGFTFTCPYCFEQSDESSIKFRCGQLSHICEWVEDDLYNKNNSRYNPNTNNIVLGKVIDTSKSYKRNQEAVCSSCNEKTFIRICPHCHFEIPISLLKSRNKIIALIGSKDSGKSHYLPALIEQVDNNVSKLKLLPTFKQDSDKYYNESFRIPLYENNEILNATISANADEVVRKPLIFDFTKFLNRHQTDKERHKNSITFIFFDAAGEDLTSEENLRRTNPYLKMADGIILLIDPLQISSIRSKLIDKGLDESLLPDKKDRPSLLLTRIVNNFENQNRNTNIPLAITLSKCDMIKDLLGKNSNLYQHYTTSPDVTIESINSLSNEIKELIFKRDNQDGLNKLVREASTIFKDHAFFAVSALGHNPEDGRLLHKPRPVMVENPLLWTLSKMWSYKIDSK